MTEAEYDALLAPKFAALAQEAADLGCDVVAVVEYAPGQRAETRTVGQDSSLAMKLLTFCAAAGQNLDAFFINVARHCNKHGIDTSSSMVMTRLAAGKVSNEGGKE